MEAIKSVLSQAFIVIKQYKKIAMLTGENFNIFKILKVGSDEVGTHSAFIGELLNVHGSHGQKAVFIKLFCEQFNIKNFNFDSSKVEIEKYISKISEDKSEGGRIDILVTDNLNNAILIENKIYAKDQFSQMLRYNNYGKRNSANCKLFYLTLFGNNPTDISAKDVDPTDFCTISYSNDILEWLEKCKEKSVNHSILRETISQYYNLIKHLTGQTMNQELKKELIDLIQGSGSNMSAAIEISNNVFGAKKLLLQKLAKLLDSKLKELKVLDSKLKELKVDVPVDSDFGSRHNGIKLYNISDQFILLSFLNDMSDPYIEVSSNTEEEWKPENKKLELLNYYRSALEKVASNWGKIENTEKAWHGYWVCRYYKLGDKLMSNSFWADIADNKAQEIVEEIANDLISVVRIMKNRSTIS